MKIFIIDKYVAMGISKVVKGKLGIFIHLVLMYFVYQFVSDKVFRFFNFISDYVFNKKAVTNVIEQINNPATFTKGLANPMMVTSLVVYFGITIFFTFLWLGGVIANRKQYDKQKKAGTPS
jgi:hypothetical protein